MEVQMRVCRLKMRMLRWEWSSGLACAAVDSNGVVRIPWYISSIEKWGMNPRPNIQVVKETPATLLVGAHRALGPVVSMKVVNMAIEKAKKAGICWALIG